MRQASKKLSRSSNHWKKKFFRKKEKLKEELNFKKLKTQLKWVVIKLEDFRNHLIFKSIEQKPKKTWADTPKIFVEFLVLEVNLPYTYEELAMQISRAYQGTKRDPTQNNNRLRGPKPIFVYFWIKVTGPSFSLPPKTTLLTGLYNSWCGDWGTSGNRIEDMVFLIFMTVSDFLFIAKIWGFFRCCPIFYY